jgi:hypothetical protein
MGVLEALTFNGGRVVRDDRRQLIGERELPPFGKDWCRVYGQQTAKGRGALGANDRGDGQRGDQRERDPYASMREATEVQRNVRNANGRRIDDRGVVHVRDPVLPEVSF